MAMNRNGLWLRRNLHRPILAAGVLGAAFCVDLPVYQWVRTHLQNVDRTDLVKFLRSAGFVPAWCLICFAIIAVDRQRAWLGWNRAMLRGGSLLSAVCAAGVMTEVLKLLFRRERPKIAGTLYQFRPIWDRLFKTNGLAMPSSHAAIAFAGAFVLARLFPEARVAWFALAVGTALSRVAEGAHYVSDVCVSVAVGALAADLATRWFNALSQRSPDRTQAGALLRTGHKA